MKHAHAIKNCHKTMMQVKITNVVVKKKL